MKPLRFNFALAYYKGANYKQKSFIVQGLGASSNPILKAENLIAVVSHSGKRHLTMVGLNQAMRVMIFKDLSTNKRALAVQNKSSLLVKIIL